MRHIAAYLLLQLGGNPSPTADDISKLLFTVGIVADEARLATLVAQLEGKDINALIAEGSKQLVTGPSQTQSSVVTQHTVDDTKLAAETVEEPQEGNGDSDDENMFGLFD